MPAPPPATVIDGIGRVGDAAAADKPAPNGAAAAAAAGAGTRGFAAAGGARRMASLQGDGAGGAAAAAAAGEGEEEAEPTLPPAAPRPTLAWPPPPRIIPDAGADATTDTPPAAAGGTALAGSAALPAEAGYGAVWVLERAAAVASDAAAEAAGAAGSTTLEAESPDSVSTGEDLAVLAALAVTGAAAAFFAASDAQEDFAEAGDPTTELPGINDAAPEGSGAEVPEDGLAGAESIAVDAMDASSVLTGRAERGLTKADFEEWDFQKAFPREGEGGPSSPTASPEARGAVRSAPLLGERGPGILGCGSFAFLPLPSTTTQSSPPVSAIPT